jgi:hypothetical protein
MKKLTQPVPREEESDRTDWVTRCIPVRPAALLVAKSSEPKRFELTGPTALTGDSIGSVFADLVLAYGSLVYFVPFVAGLALAALIPLEQFRQIAIAMALGDDH